MPQKSVKMEISKKDMFFSRIPRMVREQIDTQTGRQTRK